jgi:hypothetical protein
MSDRETTRRQIAAAVASLAPVRRFRPGRLALGWLVLGAGAATIGMVLVQSFRPGAFAELLRHPGFGAESLLGLAAVLLAGRAAIGAAVPGDDGRIPWTLLAVGALALWLAFLVGTLFLPSTPPSMAGKRAACFVEVLAWSVPLTAAGLLLQRRGFPLARRRAGMLAGLTAGLIPAWLMQFACMHDAEHGLTHHVAPVAAVVLVAALVGVGLLRSTRTRER